MPARFKGGGGGGAPSGPAGFTDDFSIELVVADSTSTPTDAATYEIALAESDTNAGQTETVTLGFPAGNFGDDNIAPSDAQAFTARVWLTGNAGSGVTSPANADGQNNGTVATLATALAGSSTETMTSPIGPAIPAGMTLTSVIYRGWFTSANTLVTSKGELRARSSSALFAEVLMFRNQDLNTTVDHSSGDFTFDLIAAGIDTSAKFASLQIIHEASDAAAGVTPHSMTVDAGCLEITGAFT